MQEQLPSKKQRELLSFIEGFIQGNGYGPSYREIMRGLDYKSVSTVAVHVDGLIAKGYLRKQDNSARSLELVPLQERVSSIYDEISLSTATAEEKWLVEIITKKLETLQAKESTAKERSDVAVLINTLRILGFEDAYIIAKKQLDSIKTA
jgi:SOS-response transcriptional repressor LexA